MRAVVFLLLLLSSVASADVLAVKAGKVSVDIPKTWAVNVKDDLIRSASGDNQVAFVLWVVGSTDTKAALTKLEGELYSSIQGLKWVEKTKKLKINKLRTTWVEGVGVNAAGAQLDVLVVVGGPTPTKKGVIMLAVVEHEKLVANEKAIQAIFQSLKPTK
jgi:hypothetical protein